MKTKKIEVTVPDMDSIPLVDSIKEGFSTFLSVYKAHKEKKAKDKVKAKPPKTQPTT